MKITLEIESNSFSMAAGFFEVVLGELCTSECDENGLIINVNYKSENSSEFQSAKIELTADECLKLKGNQQKWMDSKYIRAMDLPIKFKSK
jgi:hypothetical protein